MDQIATAAIAQAAHDVSNAAGETKRAAAAHRRHTRELLQRLDHLKRLCDQHGIRLDIDTKPEGGHGDRPDSRTDQPG